MRILHTSDWHIGRSFHGNSTLSALGEVLQALIQQVREHRVDVVLIAGDVFDSAAPSADCYTLLSQTLRGLSDAGAQVVVTSGNHDSAARLGFQSALLRDGIYVRTDPLTLDTPLTFTDEFGEVDVYGIPYLEPSIVRHVWEGVELRKQADTLTHAMNLIRTRMAERAGGPRRVRSVVISHCFTAGVQADATDGVERDVTQGGVDLVPLSTFDGADYVALGHIHGRKKLRENVRYSGAALHYSFGEQHKERGSWLVDLDATGFASAEWLALPVPRALTTIRSTLDDLLTNDIFAEAEELWVCAEYTDRTPQRDPMRRLRERFPYCALVQHTPEGVIESASQTYVERLRHATTDHERAEAFLVHVRAGEGATPDESDLLSTIIQEHERAEALS